MKREDCEFIFETLCTAYGRAGSDEERADIIQAAWRCEAKVGQLRPWDQYSWPDELHPFHQQLEAEGLL
jgi:hypothetical protein